MSLIKLKKASKSFNNFSNTSLFNDEHLFYHVLPINSLDVFPVGWAKFNGFDLLTPIE